MGTPKSDTLWMYAVETDKRVPNTGVYETTCRCRVPTKMTKGSTAPVCPVCTAPTVWKMKT